MLIESIIASLVPVGVEGIKQFVNKITGGVKPLTVDDQIKLDNSEIERAKAIVALDTPVGIPSQWVVDVRASSRYIAAWACIGIGSYLLTVPPLAIVGSELIGVAFGFLFGTRIVANFKK